MRWTTSSVSKWRLLKSITLILAHKIFCLSNNMAEHSTNNTLEICLKCFYSDVALIFVFVYSTFSNVIINLNVKPPNFVLPNLQPA